MILKHERRSVARRCSGSYARKTWEHHAADNSPPLSLRLERSGLRNGRLERSNQRRGLVKTFLPEVRTLIKRRFLPVISSAVYGTRRDWCFGVGQHFGAGHVFCFSSFLPLFSLNVFVAVEEAPREDVASTVISTVVYFYNDAGITLASLYDCLVYRGNFWQPETAF